jgi:hypothetical protein
VLSFLLPDVSEWQKTIDWTAVVHAGYPGAILRAHNGHRADAEFATNRAHAKEAGVRARGLYAYLVADRDPVTQAQEFVRIVGHLLPGEWPIVDCETGAGDQAPRVKAWAEYVSRALSTGKAWLYSGEAFYRAHDLDRAGIPATRTWLAAYGPKEPAEGHAMWQYTDHRAVPGIPGPVDCSIYHGTVDQLLAAIAPGTTTHAPGPAAHPSHPFPASIHPGGSSPSAKPLQEALKHTGWMDRAVADSDHYGTVTQHAVAGFNRKHGFNARGVAYDPAIGPHGWALLMTLAYGA